MEVLTNKNNEIINYAIVGGFTEGIVVDTIPEGFEANFKPSFYLLQNGTVVANPNYVAPVESTPDSGPTAEQESLTAMAQQMASQQQHIVSLEQALTALAQGGGKS